MNAVFVHLMSDIRWLQLFFEMIFFFTILHAVFKACDALCVLCFVKLQSIEPISTHKSKGTDNISNELRKYSIRELFAF